MPLTSAPVLSSTPPLAWVGVVALGVSPAVVVSLQTLVVAFAGLWHSLAASFELWLLWGDDLGSDQGLTPQTPHTHTPL